MVLCREEIVDVKLVNAMKFKIILKFVIDFGFDVGRNIFVIVERFDVVDDCFQRFWFFFL